MSKTTGALPPDTPVAVIGAGTMGSGIAMVAAAAGHPVLLHDAADGAAKAGLARERAALEVLVARGKLDEQTINERLARVRIAETVADLSPAGLVIEAIVENLDVKAEIFRKVEAVVAPSAILATNTSSLSVTALAGRLARPGRLGGLHFFNPPTILPLVEIVRSALSEPEVITTLYETARAWGKTPVLCASTPGFIVNRVARPFYAEALRLLGEQVADAATLDAVMRESGGFRMGPFELMDLIGHDVNFAVTRSVYEGLHGDPRYRPSIVQQELVHAGRLGRKSGHGFYDHARGAVPPEPRTEPKVEAPRRITVAGDLGPAQALVALAEACGIVVDRQPGPGVVRVGAGTAALTDGRLAGERHAQEGIDALFDLAHDYATAPRIALAFADRAGAEARRDVVGFFQALGKAVSVIDDTPALAVVRTVACLANEAAEALLQGVASAADIDLSMRKGVNYPEGPLEWADRLGLDRVAATIDNLARLYGEDRYRTSLALRRRALAGATFRHAGTP